MTPYNITGNNLEEIRAWVGIAGNVVDEERDEILGIYINDFKDNIYAKVGAYIVDLGNKNFTIMGKDTFEKLYEVR
jgi:hypothetical protein